MELIYRNRMISIILSLFLTGLVVVMHYEALAWISSRLPEIGVVHRLRILIGLAGCLSAHIAEVCVFALAYHFLIKFEKFGGIVSGDIHGDFTPTFADCLYFSFINYTTLGYGDLVPIGTLQLLAGLEALIGLVLIAWTASFMFYQMQKNW